jgi:hypothetical protein
MWHQSRGFDSRQDHYLFLNFDITAKINKFYCSNYLLKYIIAAEQLNGFVAQLEERSPSKRAVVGSIPTKIMFLNFDINSKTNNLYCSNHLLNYMIAAEKLKMVL